DAEGRDAANRPGPHADAIRRGLKFLVERQKEDGGFEAGMYAHAIVATALCDGYRVTGDAKLKKPAQKAIDYIVDAQHVGGGWRYSPRQVGDTSVTSWHVLALTQGKRAGLKIPAEAFQKASTYFDSVASDEGARYGYFQSSQA